MKTQEIINTAIETIRYEAETISNLSSFIDDKFADIVRLLFECKGRVIITGIGKSANIAGKIVATLNSTGTPSVFMHASDAIHGDLGIIQPDDVVICISKSGNTSEIKVLVPLIKSRGNILIGMLSNTESFLARQADHILKAVVDGEACPNNLAPTNSTTAQLVLGDAVAICLLKMRGFTPKDFANTHPGGTLGKKLYLRISDLYVNNEKPKVRPDDNVQNIIFEISAKRLGACAVTDDDDNLLGIITDGDLRRMLQSNRNMSELNGKDIMSLNPKTCSPDELAIDAFHIMKKNNITQIIVVEGNKYIGFVHLHDIIKEGIV